MELYEGREPYIFISYARKDKERAFPFLDALANAGYRFWYDAGIQAGAHWTETLIEKVEGCEVFCPLFSDAFNSSRFCFEETEYAFRKDKKMVPVYLEEPEETEPRPLYRLLQARQSFRLYEYADAAEFAERLARESAFALCKEKTPDWNKTGQIQWRFADGVLTIAKNEDMPPDWGYGSIPPYQYDPIYESGTAPWMPYREKILSVKIADNIDKIGDCAFWGCYSLTDVSVPDSVGAIGKRAFSNCYRLKYMNIPDSVTEIGDFAFWGCENLTYVRIPDSVSKIANSAFDSCKSLTNVRVGDSVSEIGDRAFWGCENLKSVEIPAETIVSPYAFPPYTRVRRYVAPAEPRRIATPTRRPKRYATPRRDNKSGTGQ